MAKEKRAAIIGAGLGGLSAAIHLANAGYSVDIYEKNSYPGGKAGCLSDSGFRFDTGPSLLTMPFVLKDIFKDSNENIKEYLQIEPLNVLSRYFYHDSTIINAYKNREKFTFELNSKTGVPPAAINDYLDYCKSIYDLTAQLFLFSDFQSVTNFLNLKALKALLNIKKIDPFRTMNDSIRSFFSDERIINLFSRYATYNGSNPYLAPATLNIIPHVEYNLGGFVIKEGMFALPNALAKLAAKKRVKFYFNTLVNAIETENLSVCSITAAEKKYHYPIIISNADVSYTYKNLLNSPDYINSDAYSSSAFIFYWGISGVHPQLEIHNILFAKNYRKEFEFIFNLGKIPDDPTIYIYISSKFISRDAPEGHENWFVMINTPPLKYNNLLSQLPNIDILRSRIIEKIKSFTGIDIKNKIVYEKYAGPAELEAMTNSTGGSIYGFSSNKKNSAFLRHKNNSRIKGLYFAGGTVHPGGGIPLVLLSGKLASESVIRDSL